MKALRGTRCYRSRSPAHGRFGCLAKELLFSVLHAKVIGYFLWKVRIDMESKAKLMGHSVHPMLIVFPLGLLAGSLGFDIGYMTTNNAEFATVSFWMIGAGIIGGLLAAVFGLADWWTIPANTRAKAIGLWHGVGNVLVVALFAVSWWVRSNSNGYVPPDSAFTLSCIAIALALLTGWLGGELVERLGVGVDNGAHLNAPNSLSGRPATESAAHYDRMQTGHPSRA